MSSPTPFSTFRIEETFSAEMDVTVFSFHRNREQRCKLPRRRIEGGQGRLCYLGRNMYANEYILKGALKVLQRLEEHSEVYRVILSHNDLGDEGVQGKSYICPS